MKKLLWSFLFLAVCQIAVAQPWLEKLPQDKIQNQDITFKDAQKAFNDYWNPFNVGSDGYYVKDGVRYKAGGWKPFKRWEWFWEQRINPVTGEFPATTTWYEWQKYLNNNPDAKTKNGNWESLGTDNSLGGYNGIGRLNCVAFHPTNETSFG